MPFSFIASPEPSADEENINAGVRGIILLHHFYQHCGKKKRVRTGGIMAMEQNATGQTKLQMKR